MNLRRVSQYGMTGLNILLDADGGGEGGAEHLQAFLDDRGYLNGSLLLPRLAAEGEIWVTRFRARIPPACISSRYLCR